MNRNARALVAVVSPVMALGTTDDELTGIATKLTAELGAGDTNGVGAALGLLSIADRQSVMQKMLAQGADPSALANANAAAVAMTQAAPKVAVPAWAVALHTAGMAVSAYHGYRRTQSLGWALWWGFWGACFPILVPVLAVAEGYGKPEGRS